MNLSPLATPCRVVVWSAAVLLGMTLPARADDEERIQQGSAIFDALHAYFAGQKRRRA